MLINYIVNAKNNIDVSKSNNGMYFIKIKNTENNFRNPIILINYLKF
ncbi:MAG: T9SS type A sorting domain-containing protein [Bacteroidia bacterium]|nr:T9SS type A sorting domain-containing protein [Bacteroidia bacterium]